MAKVVAEAFERRSVLSYGGVFDERQDYAPNVLITSNGSLWVSTAKAAAGDRPGRSPAWKLVAKAGSAPNAGAIA